MSTDGDQEFNIRMLVRYREDIIICLWYTCHCILFGFELVDASQGFPFTKVWV